MKEHVVFNLIRELKKISKIVSVSLVVGLLSFDIIKSIESGYFSLIHIKQLLSSPQNVLVIITIILAYVITSLLLEYYKKHDNNW